MSTTVEQPAGGGVAEPGRSPGGTARIRSSATLTKPGGANGHPRSTEGVVQERGSVPRAAPPIVEAAPRTRPKRLRLVLLLLIVLVVVSIAAVVGYRYWYDSTYFVITENAQVTGDLVQVGSLNPGRIVATRFEIGDRVRKDQELAMIAIPQQVGASPTSDAPRWDIIRSNDSLVAVRAPLDGVIVARQGFVGGTVSAGQPIYSLVDPNEIWVRANIEETRISRVRPGQTVEIWADALDRALTGRVLAITPAAAVTFSLLPSQNTSGNFIKVTQLVPVKIAVDTGGAVLPLGTSVNVRIQVREPVGGLPWQP